MDHYGLIGHVNLEGTIPLQVRCANSSGVPTAPDAAPTYKILNGAGTALTTGTLSSTDAASLTGARSGTATAAAASGFASGNIYYIHYDYAISTQARAATATVQIN